MKQKRRIFLLLLLLVYGTITMAQIDKPKSTILKSVVDVNQLDNENNARVLDAQREKGALLILLKSVQTRIASAAEAMPAVKYSFAPTEANSRGSVLSVSN